MKNKTIRSLVLESIDEINSFDGLLEASEWRRHMSNEDIFYINEAYRQFTFLEPLLARDGVSRDELWEQFLAEKKKGFVGKMLSAFGLEPSEEEEQQAVDQSQTPTPARPKPPAAPKFGKPPTAEETTSARAAAAADKLKQKLADERQTFTKIAEAFFKSQGLPPDDKTGLSLMFAALLVLYRNDGAILDVNVLNAIKKKKIPIPFYDGSPQDHPVWADALKRMKRQSNDFPLFRKKVLQKNMSQIQSMEDMLEELLIFLKSKDLLIDPTKLKVPEEQKEKPKKPTNKPQEKSKSDANADIAASEIEATEIVSKEVATGGIPKWGTRFIKAFVDSKFGNKEQNFKAFMIKLVTQVVDSLSENQFLFVESTPSSLKKDSWNTDVGPAEQHAAFRRALSRAANYIQTENSKGSIPASVYEWLRSQESAGSTGVALKELIKSILITLAKYTLLSERKKSRSRISF